MTGLTVLLQDLESDALALGGGKAVNLGVLLRAGLPVPLGFCITTRAYVRAARAVPVDDPERARELLARQPVPEEVAAAVVAAYRRLSAPGGGDVAVAVRSSATAEDLPYASFAGQQDTLLDVVGETALLAAVRRCWASLWTDRAVAYRAANDIDPAGVRLAVVVQRMVPARAAGVLFTADALTGRRGHAVIDAARGLGDAVVSGAVNPDHYVVETSTGTVLDRQVPDGRPACLDEAELRRLAELGRRVEVLYDGTPQDIEFAVDAAGAVWLLQARAITTLFPLPVDAPPPDSGDLRVYFSVNVAQGVLRPFTPLGQQMFRLAASGVSAAAGVPQPDPARGPRVLTVAGERVFIDFTPLLRSEPGRRLAGFALARMEARSAAAVRALTDDARLTPVPGSRVRALRRALTLLVRARAPARVLAALRHPAQARRQAQARVRAVVQAPLCPPDATAADRLRAVERALIEGIPTIALTLLPLMLTGMAGFVLAFAVLGRRASVEERDAVRRSLPHNPTTRMDLALWALADRVRADDDSKSVLGQAAPQALADAYLTEALPSVLQQGLAAFLAEHGHRGVAEIDLGLPRWAEAPAHVLGVLADYVQRPDGTVRPDEHFAAGAVRAEALVEELATRRGRLGGALVRFGLGRGRELAGLREAPKEAVMALTARLRRELLGPLGVELAVQGRLERPDDLAFLDLREAHDAVKGADLREVVRMRRSRYDVEVRRLRVPRILLSDGTEPATAASDETGVSLRGAPASAGVVTGPARVVLDPVEARLEPGQILVAPSTDPGWTPLFLTAAGLVMEMGGAMSHGAVVAREYGIPAVVGVPDATARIRSGQRITVDGGAGTVALGDGEEAHDEIDRHGSTPAN